MCMEPLFNLLLEVCDLFTLISTLLFLLNNILQSKWDFSSRWPRYVHGTFIQPTVRGMWSFYLYFYTFFLTTFCWDNGMDVKVAKISVWDNQCALVKYVILSERTQGMRRKYIIRAEVRFVLFTSISNIIQHTQCKIRPSKTKYVRWGKCTCIFSTWYSNLIHISVIYSIEAIYRCS